jgi:type II secretion system protein N
MGLRMLKKVCAWLIGRLGYILYTLVLVVVLLWTFFPKEGANRWIVRYLNSTYPQLNWQVQSIVLQLPEGLILGGLEGYEALDNKKKPLIRVDLLTLRPDILGTVKARKLQATFDILLAQGAIAGTVLLDGAKGGVTINGTVKGMQLAELSLVTRHLQRDLQGTVSATFGGALQPHGGNVTACDAKIEVDNGRFELKQPVLEHLVLPFSHVTVNLHGHGGTWQLEQGTVESNLFSGQFAGAINLAQDPAASLLNISGTLRPRPEFFKGVNNAAVLQIFRAQLKNKPLPFKVSGNLRNPGIHFEEFSSFFQALE